jgi:hypothetical protein
VRLEGQAGVQLERYLPEAGQKGDWIDRASGLVYDGCSPAPSAFFARSWPAYQRSLADHLAHPRVNRVVVDVSDLNLTPEQLQALLEHLDSLPADDQSRILDARRN